MRQIPFPACPVPLQFVWTSHWPPCISESVADIFSSNSNTKKKPQLRELTGSGGSGQLKILRRLHDFKRKLSGTFVLEDANITKQGPIVQQL